MARRSCSGMRATTGRWESTSTHPPDPSVAYQTLPLLLAPYQRPGYRSDSMIVFGSQQENTDLFAQQATFAKSWNETYAYPKMEYSGFYDAMKRIAAPFGD